jgi:hypothetical protein
VQGQQHEARMAELRIKSRKRSEAVDQDSQKNPKTCIFFKKRWCNTVRVETPQLPSKLPKCIDNRQITRKVRRAYLKMTQSMGIGLFADENMDEGDIAAVYNGVLRDLEPGETRGNTDADFGSHLQSLSKYGGVQGAGTQTVDGALQGDCDLEFFVREGAMSLMNSSPSSMEHNVDLVVWPRLDSGKVSGDAVDSLQCLQEACSRHIRLNNRHGGVYQLMELIHTHQSMCQ